MEYGRTDKGNIFIYANVLDENNNKLDYILVKEKSKHFANSYTLEKKWLKDEKIVKHSKNIIDLIETGDIVEYKKGNYTVKTDVFEDEGQLVVDDLINLKSIRKIKIKSILTHERYQPNCYRLEE